MNNHHLDLNPLALCYTIAMFSLAISPDAIGNSSGLLLFTTELYVAAKKELGIMKTDDTWKDCALQTVQAFRRLRKYDKRAVSSPIYNAIEGISMGISGGQAALRPVTGNAHGDMEEVIVAEATYVCVWPSFSLRAFYSRNHSFLKEPSASQFRREFGLQQYDGVKFERFEDEDDDDGAGDDFAGDAFKKMIKRSKLDPIELGEACPEVHGPSELTAAEKNQLNDLAELMQKFEDIYSLLCVPPWSRKSKADKFAPTETRTAPPRRAN